MDLRPHPVHLRLGDIQFLMEGGSLCAPEKTCLELLLPIKYPNTQHFKTQKRIMIQKILAVGLQKYLLAKIKLT